jgi:hypothetical protein
MKFQIARDARPQARTLIMAAAVTFALWFVPYASVVAYPFRLFVTFIHEGGHALAAVLTGNSVRSVEIFFNGEGVTRMMVAPGVFSNFLISSAGYLSAIGFGALLLWMIRHRFKARVVLAGSALLIAALTAIYGFVVPLTDFSLMPFTVLAGAAITAGLLAAAKYLPLRAANFLVGFLAVQCVLNAVFDLKSVAFMSAFSNETTDAADMAAATGVPAIIWALLWAAVGFVVVSLALRAYAVSRTRPSQPDLPFEDPLEV